MARSRQDKVILAAGRELERTLELAQSTDVLARWMVYRLAELRHAVGTVRDDKARAAARAEQDELILALWANRAVIPGGVSTDRRLKGSLALIDALLAKCKPWHRSAEYPVTPPELIDAMRSASQRLVVAAAVLLRQRHALTEGPDDPDLPLTRLERKAGEQMEELRRLVIPRIVVVQAGEARTEPSLEEELTLLEMEVGTELDNLSMLVSALRASLLLPGKGRAASSKSNSTGRASRKDRKASNE